MHDGYIRLYRCMEEKGWSRDPEYVAVWVALLMKATFREREVLIDGQIKQLQPGQMLTSRKALSERTGVEVSKIERILKVFKSEQQIEQQTASKYRVITITNWHKYQIREQQIEQQMNSKRTADEHKQERKERKTIKPLQEKTPAESRLFSDWFCYAFEKVMEYPYNFEGAKDGKLLADMLARVPMKNLVAKACHFLSDPDRFPKNKAPTLSFLKSKLNDYPDAPGEKTWQFREMGLLPPEGVKLEDWKLTE